MTAVLGGRDCVESKCHSTERGTSSKDTVHTKMKVTFAGSDTLLGCTFTLGSPEPEVGVGKVSFAGELTEWRKLGVRFRAGSLMLFTMVADVELGVGTTDTVSGRILAIYSRQ